MKKEEIFVDTNIFIRYLTNDDILIADKIEQLFKQALHGKVSLITNTIVIIELIWVLESYYELSKNEIEKMVLKIINTKGLEIEKSQFLLKALDIYISKNIDFTDAYNAIYMDEHHLSRILTLDKKHFSRIDNINIEKL